MISPAAWSCTPQVELSKPPRLVNGEWVQAPKLNNKEITQSDYKRIKSKNYDFIFSGIYTKEASFSGKTTSYIETKKIWRGKVKKTVDVEVGKLPTDNKCSKMKFNQEYVFFGKLGSRNKPIQLKEFRKSSPELKSLLGKPPKQWLRGRLIQHNK